MIKKIYTFIISTAMLFAAQNSINHSNIKKIIQKNGKIIVVIKEKGKEKKIELSSKDIAKLTNSYKKSSKKSSSKKSKKVTSKSNSKLKVSKKEKTKNSKNIYIVKKGDTLFSIALKYKVSIEDLKKTNKLKSAILQPGQEIKIPKKGYKQKAKEAVAKNKKTVYVVKKGDTLYSISKKYNMKIETIRKLNNLKKHPKLKPGMELTVLGKPVLIEKRKKPTKYVVKQGDTLWSISKKFGLSIFELRILNSKVRRRLIRKGDVLKVSKEEAQKLIKLAKKKRAKRKKRHNLRGGLAKYYNSGSGNRVVRYAKRWLGSRYVWGASRPGAFDCSGFTQYVMKKVKGKLIPRVSRRQAYYGKYVSRRNLRPGDLIFFDTSRRRRGYVNHVGIYIGNNLFIHASSARHRVVITSLNKPFYRSRFMWGRRIN